MIKNKKVEQKQSIKLVQNDSKINLLIILVLIVGFISAIGVFISQDVPSEIQSCPDFKLSESDFNRLIQLEYQGGFCERMGLESNVLVKDLNGTPYGELICVAGEE